MPQPFLFDFAQEQPALHCDEYDQHAKLKHMLHKKVLVLALSDTQAKLVCEDNLSKDFAPLASFCVVGQALNIRVLSEVLHTLYGAGCRLAVREHQFTERFAGLALDVFVASDNPHAKQALSATELQSLANQYKIDIIKKGQAYLDKPGLLVMDMDSTVIAMECIDEIAGLAGVKESVAEVTERAMRGEIDFTESLHHRVACLAGISESDLLSIRKRLPFMPGFIQTMSILKEHRWRLAIASGGFTYFADYVKEVAGLDAAFSNQLEIVNKQLSGKVLGKVVDGEEKARVLSSLAKQFDIPVSQTIAIGDGANDLIMMRSAGSSVAYHAKPAVSEAARSAIIHCGFEGLLYSLN